MPGACTLGVTRLGGPVPPRELLKGGGKDALNGVLERHLKLCQRPPFFATDRQFPWDHDCYFFRILTYSITINF